MVDVELEPNQGVHNLRLLSPCRMSTCTSRSNKSVLSLWALEAVINKNEDVDI
jgi:hypothetical protein